MSDISFLSKLIPAYEFILYGSVICVTLLCSHHKVERFCPRHTKQSIWPSGWIK